MTDIIPEFIAWPNRGQAIKMRIRGMSDYARGCDSGANYITDDNFVLKLRHNKWQAQYKNKTTKWFDSYEDAISNLENRLKK